MTALLAEHNIAHKLHHVEYALLINCNYHVVLLFGHSCHKTVSCDACVVYQNVDGAEACLYVPYHLLALVVLGNVCAEYLCLNAQSLYLVNDIVVFKHGHVKVVESNVHAVLCKSQGNGCAYSS